MNKRHVYIRESKNTSEMRNGSTGTKIYERLANACNKIDDRFGDCVVEYELVPTGRRFNEHKEEIQPSE